MNSQEYLKKQLDCLVENFPSIKVKYEADSINNCHFIEISPSEVYKADINYQEAEDKITLDFITEYPTENIVFISENNETTLSNIDYEIFGSEFHINRISILSDEILQNCFLSYSNQPPTTGIFKAFEPIYYNLGSTLLIGALPAVHPFLNAINYHSSPHQYTMDFGNIGMLSVTPSLRVEDIPNNEQTALAA